MGNKEKTKSDLNKEYISYIYSEEFISKFGDWEKANRLERLKNSESLFLNHKKIIVFGKDRTEEVKKYKAEKNIKGLSKIVADISQEIVQNLRLEQNLTPGESPKLKVTDGNRNININISMLKDVVHHNLLQKGHIESICNIPEIVKNAIYIGKEKNEDKRKPELKQFYYFAEGIKIENVDYTAKVVFAKKNNGEFFYDQSLSTVEKDLFLKSIKKSPEALNQINRLEYFEHSDGTPSTYYDKRLINICQVPQMPYLEKVNGKWLPTKEAVEAVKNGELYIQKNGQEYRMIDLYSSLNKEDISYIYSEEFISKFGDWEKANRLERLKAAETLIGNERIIAQGNDITDLVDRLRRQYSPSNMKQLQLIARSIGKDVLNELRKTQGLNEYDYPIIRNEDQNIFYKMQSSSMKEISRHNIFQKGHIEAIRFTPNLIKKAIFIGAEENEDGRNLSLKKFFYYGAGLKTGNEVYTSKIVFIENDKGEIFYDESHSTIEKTRLIDIVQKRNKPETFNPQKRQDSFELLENKSHATYYDKRLINICQVPQMPYLEKVNGKWLPTKEAVEAVKNGKLYIQKNGQEYRMIDYKNNTKEIKNNIFFTYNDFYFVSVRKFSEEEKTFVDSVVSNEQNKKLLSKNALYYAGYLESQKPVSEQKFEKALKVFSKADFLQTSKSDADIFYCLEKGTFYTALNNDFLVPLESTYISEKQEKDLFENRFFDEIESFKNDNFDFLKGKLSYELDEKKDFALMSDISDVLSEGEIFTRRNVNIDGEIKIKLGDLFDKKNPEKIQPTGVRHLIKHRMEERLNNGLSMEDSQKETAAILFLAVSNIDKAPAIKEPNGKYAIYKDGIRTTIGKDKKGKFVVSGFDYADTKREATDSIGTVIARYGYTPGFLEIYDQVGAVASELNIHKENSVVNDKKSDYEKLLYTSAEIDVNGKVRHCKNGLMKGFENAVSLLDSTFAENSRLRDENSKLKSRIYSIYSECEKLSKDNEELKKQALKNKIRPMGM